jgi:hypothetical protein
VACVVYCRDVRAAVFELGQFGSKYSRALFPSSSLSVMRSESASKRYYRRWRYIHIERAVQAVAGHVMLIPGPVTMVVMMRMMERARLTPGRMAERYSSA